MIKTHANRKILELFLSILLSSCYILKQPAFFNFFLKIKNWKCALIFQLAREIFWIFHKIEELLDIFRKLKSTGNPALLFQLLTFELKNDFPEFPEKYGRLRNRKTGTSHTTLAQKFIAVVFFILSFPCRFCCAYFWLENNFQFSNAKNSIGRFSKYQI